MKAAAQAPARSRHRLFLGRLRPSRACLRFVDIFYCIRVFRDVKPRLPSFSVLLDLSATFLLDFDVPSLWESAGLHVVDCSVKPLLVVEVDVHRDLQMSMVKVRQTLAMNTLRLEGLVPAFNLVVALRGIGRGGHMGVAVHGDELLELLSNKLPPVVRDEPWTCLRKDLQSLLLDNSDIAGLHGREDLP